MAKLCPNCHNTIDDKSVFCDNCGTKLEVTPNTEFQQPTAPHFSPPEQQYYQPAPQYIQAEKPQPAANKSNGILISLIIGAATLVAAIVIIAIVVFPRLNFNGANNNSDIFSSVIDSGLETSEKESRYEFDDSANEPSDMARGGRALHVGNIGKWNIDGIFDLFGERTEARPEDHAD